MNYNDIRKMAKDMGIKSHRMKKQDLIHVIQRTENNIECFGTPRVDYCDEEVCLWREDCVSTNHVLNNVNPL
jgi:hypothetical protein